MNYRGSISYKEDMDVTERIRRHVLARDAWEQCLKRTMNVGPL